MSQLIEVKKYGHKGPYIDYIEQTKKEKPKDTTPPWKGEIGGIQIWAIPKKTIIEIEKLQEIWKDFNYEEAGWYAVQKNTYTQIGIVSFQNEIRYSTIQGQNLLIELKKYFNLEVHISKKNKTVCTNPLNPNYKKRTSYSLKTLQ